MSLMGEAIKAGAGERAIRIKAGAGALLFLSNYTRIFAHMIKTASIKVWTT